MKNLVIKSLKEKESKLLGQLDIVRSMIEDEERSSCKERPIQDVHTEPFTPPTLGNSVNKRFLNVLKNKQRFMKVREIAEVIVRDERGDVEDWVKKLSRNTRKLKEMGKIVKYQVGNARVNAFWGSSDWIVNGEIKEGFEYDPKALADTKYSPLKDFEL